MVNSCYCMEFPELPLGGNYEPYTFKLYFADTGFLVSMVDDESQEDLRANKNLGVYKGALYELSLIHIFRLSIPTAPTACLPRWRCWMMRATSSARQICSDVYKRQVLMRINLGI